MAARGGGTAAEGAGPGEGLPRGARTFAKGSAARSGPDPRGGTAASRPRPRSSASGGPGGLSRPPASSFPLALRRATRGEAPRAARGRCAAVTRPAEAGIPRGARRAFCVCTHGAEGGGGASAGAGPSLHCAPLAGGRGGGAARRRPGPPRSAIFQLCSQPPPPPAAAAAAPAPPRARPRPALLPPSLPPSRTAAALAQADGVSVAPRPAPPRRRPAAPRPSPQTFGAPRSAPRRRCPAPPSPPLPASPLAPPEPPLRAAAAPRSAPLRTPPLPPLLPFRRPPPALGGSPDPASPRIGARGAAAERGRGRPGPPGRRRLPRSPRLLLSFTILSLFSGHRPYFFSPLSHKKQSGGRETRSGNGPNAPQFGGFRAQTFPPPPLQRHPRGSEPPAGFCASFLATDPFLLGAGLRSAAVSILCCGRRRSSPARGAAERGAAGRRSRTERGGARPLPPESCPLPSPSSRPFPCPSGAADARRPFARRGCGAGGIEGRGPARGGVGGKGGGRSRPGASPRTAPRPPTAPDGWGGPRAPPLPGGAGGGARGRSGVNGSAGRSGPAARLPPHPASGWGGGAGQEREGGQRAPAAG